jgi:hypothetical protein
MNRVAVFMILYLLSNTAIAAEYCYETTPADDRALSFMATRDGKDVTTSFMEMNQSALAQIMDQLMKIEEISLIESARQCISNDGTFVVRYENGIAIGECR